MPKRKRGEPSLDDKLAQWRKELARGLKTAKGFERQRLSKRIREADAEKKPRLEREVAVLKSLDLHQAANAHLCSSLLKIKGVSESPKLPADVKIVSKPAGLSEEEKTALHNVTSALCNRKQVKDVIEEAVMGTCIALKVPMPERKGKGKGKSKDVENEEDRDTPKEKKKKTATRAEKEEQADDRHMDAESLEKHDEEEGSELDIILLKRQLEGVDYNDAKSIDGSSEPSESPEFNGFSDSDAEERALVRYDDFVGGSSSSDEDKGEDEEDSDDEDASDEDDFEYRRAQSVRKLALDDISVSSEDSEDSEQSDSSDSEGSAVSPPPKKSRTRSTAVPTRAGTSAFLPTLMGGYISGSESASDVDIAPVRKNRRGQRARQAIWEKKYGDKAKHHEKARNSRDHGWDMKRGAVGGGEDDESGGRPWKRGIQNPFEKQQQHVHPQRQQRMQRGGEEPQRQRPERQEIAQSSRPNPKPAPTRDDTGPLHPSWAAAKKAKEENQKVAFQGKKVTFD